MTHQDEYYSVTGSTAETRITPSDHRLQPPLYFGDASTAAERVATTKADVRLF